MLFLLQIVRVSMCLLFFHLSSCPEHSLPISAISGGRLRLVGSGSSLISPHYCFFPSHQPVHSLWSWPMELSQKAFRPSNKPFGHPIIQSNYEIPCAISFHTPFTQSPRANPTTVLPLTETCTLPQTSSFIYYAPIRYALMHVNKMLCCIFRQFYVVPFPLIYFWITNSLFWNLRHVEPCLRSLHPR